MILNDDQIQRLALNGGISPFVPHQVRHDGQRPVISYGLSSYGYDIRLSPNEFKVLRYIPGTVVDPKNYDPTNLIQAPLRSDDKGDFFVLPAHSYALGVAIERLEVPPNVTILCLGKSTYARAGIIANLTPAESGWVGHLTLEFSNASGADCRMYTNEGVVQLLFFEGDPCSVSYATRQGKYQDQGEEVTIARA